MKLKGMLVSCCCCNNKLPQMQWLKKMHKCIILQLWRSEVLKWFGRNVFLWRLQGRNSFLAFSSFQKLLAFFDFWPLTSCSKPAMAGQVFLALHHLTFLCCSKSPCSSPLEEYLGLYTGPPGQYRMILKSLIYSHLQRLFYH